jgi:phosphoglycolate phosphatase
MTETRLPVEGLLFDLDGTLVDSLPDLAEAINELMATNGLPLHAERAVASMVGKGVKVLVDKAFKANGVVLAEPALDAAIVRYLGFYEPRATRLTRLFPFVAETVKVLAGRYKLAVCTNKPERVSREIVESFGLGEAISVVVGGDSGATPKPAPDMMWLTAKRLGLAPERCVMIGDSGNDVASAKAAGLRVALVRDGYTDVPADELGADYVMDDFRAIPEMLAAIG